MKIIAEEINTILTGDRAVDDYEVPVEVRDAVNALS